MILIVALPLMIVIIALASAGIVNAFRYNVILSNVTTALDFNQNFTITQEIIEGRGYRWGFFY